jgi:hypothetical protein
LSVSSSSEKLGESSVCKDAIIGGVTARGVSGESAVEISVATSRTLLSFVATFSASFTEAINTLLFSKMRNTTDNVSKRHTVTDVYIVGKTILCDHNLCRDEMNFFFFTS